MRVSWINGNQGQWFAGLQGSAAVLGGQPSALTNLFAIGFDNSDTNLHLLHNDGSGAATKVDLGLSRVTPQLIDFIAFCPPNGQEIIARILNRSADTVLLDNVAFATDIPDAAQFLALHNQVRNFAGAGGQISCQQARIYCRSNL
jgi:hypothetical protein